MIVIPRQDPIEIDLFEGTELSITQEQMGGTANIFIDASHVPALCLALTELAEKAIRLQAAAVPHPSEVDE